MKTIKYFPLLVCGLMLAWSRPAAAQDVYYGLPLASLKFTDGTLPPDTALSWSLRRSQLTAVVRPYVVLDGPGEAYVISPVIMPWGGDTTDPGTLHVRLPKGVEISGRLFMPQTNFVGMVPLSFKLAAAGAKTETKAAFYEAKEEYYERLRDRSIPGAAWFRHQAILAGQTLSLRTNLPSEFEVMGRREGRRDSELENTYELFTGGRALSENLQLDRTLPRTATNQATVPISELTGITIREMKWKELIKDARPELDPLASCIPADQHAVFFPTFQAMTRMIDEADANGTPVLQLLEPRAEDAGARTRYQKQLCLGLTEISRLLGPQVVASVAFTGSDPFLRVGTDVAILFEARNPELLKGFLMAQQKSMQAANPEAKSVNGDVAGVAYSGLVSPDRAISSYLAVVSNVVIVSNSRNQLESLVQVAKGAGTKLSDQEEYIFFRNRYPRTDKDETALVVLTDATIRRWCGPKWRIADSRRTRAAAVLAEMQAAHLGELATGKAAGTALAPGFPVPDAGEFRLTPGGVVSSTYGSLDFMTPILEMPLLRVTRAEADAYDRWRDSYQRNWRQYFDPIAIRFSITRDRLGAELTVTPLIANSDYRELMEVTSGAQIAADAGDPHPGTLVHLAFAINTQSRPFQSAGSLLGNMAPGLRTSPFAWMGQSLAVYADDDAFWERFREAADNEKFFEHNFQSLPVALHFEVKNPLSLAAFLTAVHAFVDQSAPRMTTWENLDYQNQAYVKVTARSPNGGEETPKEVAVYYAATPRSLVLTMNEPLLKRALDRLSAASSTNAAPKKPAASPWPGKNICALADRKFFDFLAKMFDESYQTHLQVLAWNNLPILNEWKRLYPDKDPVKFHEQFWGTKLLCPGGGTYVWNEKWQTMESTIFGHPGEPKESSGKALSEILSAQLGITFENQGLSAKGVLMRK